MKRIVPEQMVDNGVAQLLPRTATIPGYENASRFADFFSHLLTDDKEAILGEDQSFCKRWLVGCGGDIWGRWPSQISGITEDYVLRGQYAMSAQKLVVISKDARLDTQQDFTGHASDTPKWRQQASHSPGIKRGW